MRTRNTEGESLRRKSLRRKSPRRKSPLASRRRETVERCSDSARRPERSVSAAPVESDRGDVGAKRTDSQLRVDNAVACFHDCQLQF